MGLETHSSDRSALCLVVEKLQPHSQGEILEGSEMSTQGNFIMPAVLPGCRQSHQEN